MEQLKSKSAEAIAIKDLCKYVQISEATYGLSVIVVNISLDAIFSTFLYLSSFNSFRKFTQKFGVF